MLFRANDQYGTIKFKELSFDEEGTYNYTILEKNAGTSDDKGITYDNQPVEVLVQVTKDSNGKLTSTVSYANGDNVFNNSYEPTPVDATFEVTKKLTGRKLIEGEFEFVLIENRFPNPTPTRMPARRRITPEENVVLQKTKNTAAGSVKFKPIVYERAGIYQYTIEETNAGQTIEGVTYDNLKVDVTVVVTDDGKGKLTVEIFYSEDTEFNNSYETSEAKAGLAAKKTLTGRELKAGEFEFVLKNQSNEEVATAKNDKEGNIKFSELTFGKVGIYTYTISEVKGGDEDIIYDNLKVKVTIVVTDDGKGKLVAKVKYPDDIEFNNKYIKPTTTTTTTEELTTTTTTVTTTEPTTTSTTTTTVEPTTTSTTTTTVEPTTTSTPTTTVEPTTTSTTTATVEPVTTTAVNPPTTTAIVEPPTTSVVSPTTDLSTTTTDVQLTTVTTTSSEPTTTAIVNPTTTVVGTTVTVEPTTTVAATSSTVEPTTTVATTTIVSVPGTTGEIPPPAGKKRKNLPKTGEENGLTITLVGFSLMTVAGIASVQYWKAQKD